ncbi:putative flagellar hook-associated protein [Desulforapulum autotrophicum HRM2]|uniref:Flagellar hook-associated protein 1 n=1 Tax=Desulforapulum autotrophicum (strain ATCC 43914 / DSM 3382 / VKM B-1955 / HRM2) TaxID=177437 RepID=C0QA36_DESAH|nr:flagellar hook-associated protein FlgK [Desulforapulum autotrophicum]ACN16754.1 putative flagellar hook-associated protein [Desulforapulum autotrophicum HRM2]
MAGISSTLNIAQGAIAAQQYGLNVTGNNIANVNNPDYSLQVADQKSNTPASYSGFLFGTGVSVDQIQQRVNQLLENRLTDAKSSQAAFEEAESYLSVVESFFDESSETSINSIMGQFWTSWQDLSNNPLGSSERVAVYDTAKNLTERFNSVNGDLAGLRTDLNSEISTTLGQINDITDQIADINLEITGLELNKTANGQRDERNALVDELGTLININTFEQSNGAIIINAGNGFSLVNGGDNYALSFDEDQVMWQGSYGSKVDISDKISGGKLGGWLDLRDEIIPKYQADIDVLAENMIWTMNYQHSQGAGLTYFTDPVVGEYQADDSGLLSSLAFGDRIDYGEDFKMWIMDQSGSEPVYRSVEVDMGISEAAVSDWEGTALGSVQASYQLTVVEGATVGDREVAEFDGSGLAEVQTGTSVSEALNLSIAGQTLTISGGPDGTQKIDVQDIGGQALRSAASIADALNKIDGVEAHASETSATFDLGGVPLDGEEVKYTLVVDGIKLNQTFTVDSTVGTFQKQFEDSLGDAAETINGINTDEDFSAAGLTVTSSSGKTIGVQGLEIGAVDGSETITFEGAIVNEAGFGDEVAVITGTVTLVHNPGMSFSSSVSGSGNGEIFENGKAVSGSSIITLGGKDGFTNFTDGDTVGFNVDGHKVSYTPDAGFMTDEDHADRLVVEIKDVFLTDGVDGDYTVFATGGSVSILKDSALEEPIEITNFTEAVSNDATLRVSTGTGSTTNQPVNGLLESKNAFGRNSASSTLYNETGWIQWEKRDTEGLLTGESGLIQVQDDGRVEIQEQGVTTLSFNIGSGTLVAGNTLTLNTDTSGTVDPLDFRIRGTANSISDTYMFTVESGGKVGTLPEYGESPLVIRWTSSNGYGSFEIEGEDPPLTPETPFEVEVDGMTLVISDGTLFTGDVFTITTDTSGNPLSTNGDGWPTGERLSDWHWTLDSFADQVNRTSSGISASATLDNRLTFEASDTYHDVVNLSFENASGNVGFMAANTLVSVENYANLDFEVQDLTFARADSGQWTVQNDPTGGNITLLPDGGDDDGFGIDFNGDEIADIKVSFKNKITGEGSLSFDLLKTDASELSFAFGDDSGTTAGVMAAAGINTFFSGNDSMTMAVNHALLNSNYISAAMINNETGEISQGDNRNALNLSDLQFKTIDMETWSYDRGVDAESSLTLSTLDSYYQRMIGSLGIKSRSIQSSRQFSDVMVTNLTDQRDAISAVSLDEEMINLIKYQHAFGAASKLVTVSDEMLNTLLGMR